MSRIGGKDATPATRRSARISQAGSVTGQSIVTTMTTGGTKTRKRGPLAKVTSRKSNTYGSSGRVGAAEALTLSATGFAQAFQVQRGGAVARDDDDEDDEVDELGAETPRMSGALNGYPRHHSPSVEPEAPTQDGHGLSFEESEGITPSENGFPASIGDTSKSFGPGHEAGMLLRPSHMQPIRSPSEDRYTPPLWQKNLRERQKKLSQQRLPEQALSDYQDEEEVQVEVQAEVQAVPEEHPTQPSPATPEERAAIEKSVDDLVVEEQERLRREGPPQPRSRSRKQASAQRLNSPQLVDEWLGGVEPGLTDEPEWKWWKYVMLSFAGMVGLLLVSQALHAMMSSQYPESAQKYGMMSAVNTRLSRAWYDVADWIMPDEHPAVTKKKDDDFKRGDGTLDDNLMWSRMRRIYEEFDGRMGDMKDTITDLNEHLPDMLVVRRHPDGRREITDEFWHALLSKANTSGNDADWTNFINSNKDKLRDLFGVSVPEGATGARPEAVSRQEFVRFVQQHYEKISDEVDKKVLEAMQGQATHIKTIAQEEARKTIIDSIRLQSLAQSNLLTNYELNLRKTNYFSPGLGALIEPTLTSTTFMDSPRFLGRLARRLALIPLRNPPKSALEKWEEPGDCWCAAPNPAMNGQAQLTVSLPHPVYPEQVTIEHLPMALMPGKKITNAPRLIELWVETDQRAQYQFSHREGVCQDGPVGWTCLGAFAYNIHASNHQQTFDLDAQSPVPVTKAMVRVTSSWGADHTCLYRVRLHGKDAVEDHEYKVRLNDPAE